MKKTNDLGCSWSYKISNTKDFPQPGKYCVCTHPINLIVPGVRESQLSSLRRYDKWLSEYKNLVSLLDDPEQSTYHESCEPIIPVVLDEEIDDDSGECMLTTMNKELRVTCTTDPEKVMKPRYEILVLLFTAIIEYIERVVWKNISLAAFAPSDHTIHVSKTSSDGDTSLLFYVVDAANCNLRLACIDYSKASRRTTFIVYGVGMNVEDVWPLRKTEPKDGHLQYLLSCMLESLSTGEDAYVESKHCRSMVYREDDEFLWSGCISHQMICHTNSIRGSKCGVRLRAPWMHMERKEKDSDESFDVKPITEACEYVMFSVPCTYSEWKIVVNHWQPSQPFEIPLISMKSVDSLSAAWGRPLLSVNVFLRESGGLWVNGVRVPNPSHIPTKCAYYLTTPLAGSDVVRRAVWNESILSSGLVSLLWLSFPEHNKIIRRAPKDCIEYFAVGRILYSQHNTTYNGIHENELIPFMGGEPPVYIPGLRFVGYSQQMKQLRTNGITHREEDRPVPDFAWRGTLEYMSFDGVSCDTFGDHISVFVQDRSYNVIRGSDQKGECIPLRIENIMSKKRKRDTATHKEIMRPVCQSLSWTSTNQTILTEDSAGNLRLQRNDDSWTGCMIVVISKVMYETPEEIEALLLNAEFEGKYNLDVPTSDYVRLLLDWIQRLGMLETGNGVGCSMWTQLILMFRSWRYRVSQSEWDHNMKLHNLQPCQRAFGCLLLRTGDCAQRCFPCACILKFFGFSVRIIITNEYHCILSIKTRTGYGYIDLGGGS